MARIETWAGERAPVQTRRKTTAKQVVQRYYAYDAVPCPVGCGGVAEIVRVNTRGGGGGGELWTECTSCAQRDRFEVPAATSDEREAVGNALGRGQPVICARHATAVPLERRGRSWRCPACGVVYRE